MPAFIDITGQRFGRLVASHRAPSTRDGVHWHCQCDCGEAIIVRSDCLKSGNTRSCGCLLSEATAARASKLFRKHGIMAGGTRPFTIDTWQHMIDRCANPKARGWNRYGGRGIRVCERWMVFENFHTDIMTKLGPRPEGHTLDRIDNNGNYEPDNVRWATAKQQANNRRSNRAKEVQL